MNIRWIMQKQTLDVTKFDIYRPVETKKKFKITANMVIIALVIIILILILKIFLFDAILFNPALEWDVTSRELARTFAYMTRVPEVNIDYSQIDTTHFVTMMMQLLKMFIVDPIINRAETEIMSSLDKIFQMVPGKLSF